MQAYDLMILGQPCLDRNVDYTGAEERSVGGAVVYSGYSAASTGARVAVLTKCSPADIDPAAVFERAPSVRVFALDSPTSTLMENIYHTADREKRTSRCTSMIEPYRPEDIPDISAAIYHLAGLVRGDLGEEIIDHVSQRGKVALDVQSVLRCVEDQQLVFHDWTDKFKYLPKIDFLKTDAAEAEVLTGMTDRIAAARQLCAWGSHEVMITHHTEAIICDGQSIYTAPLRPRSLVGRTGRGDTIFAAYLCQRLKHGIQESLNYAAALVSLKMETPGPFMGTAEDVAQFRKEIGL